MGDCLKEMTYFISKSLLLWFREVLKHFLLHDREWMADLLLLHRIQFLILPHRYEQVKRTEIIKSKVLFFR